MPTCPSCQADVAEGAKFCTFCGGLVPKAKVESADPLIGRIFARNFRIEKLLGVGGMGKVYKGTQLSLDKPVVLKLLHAHYADDETLVHRFHREARAASRLNHPNSISIIDFGQDDDGMLFMAMEYLDGRDLFTVLQKEDPIGEHRIAHIVMQVCSALSDAHDQGVVHRDLKPENIMVLDRKDQRDYVKVLDFGIAKMQDPGGKETRALTAQGMVCGTPEYMAPEQARGEDLDARTDIYALGVLMYQLVTSQLPFQADNAIGIVTKHIVEKPKPPREAFPDRNISQQMNDIILRCMAKKSADRFPNVVELSEALAPVAMAGITSSQAGLAAALASSPAVTAPSDLVMQAEQASTGPMPVSAGPTAGSLSGAQAVAAPGRNKIVLAAAGGGGALLVIAVALVMLLRPTASGGDNAAAAGTRVDTATPVVATAGGERGAEGQATAHAEGADPRPSQPRAGADDGDDDSAATEQPTTVKARDPQPEPRGHRDPAPQGDKPDEPAVDKAMVRSLINKGRARAEAGDYREAINLFEKARQHAPHDSKLLYALASAYDGAGQTDDYCSTMRRYLQLDRKVHPIIKDMYKNRCE